ncbi:MAG: MBL fold metallo-hydrolase [Micrococcales bacterium]
MKITKHGHACLELLEGGQRILIDPGFYTESVVAVDNVLAVVITHKHDDHCFEQQLSAILATNPEVCVFGTDEVRERLGASMPRLPVTAVHHGDFYEIGPFTLEFFGDLHQEIHRSIPLIQNCGVMVNDRLYYPGDSYTQPDRPVELLACPASAPWLKIGDVMDFVAAVKPRRSFATHNALLSDFGHELNNGRIAMVTEQGGGSFEYLRVGESTEV